MVVELFLLRGDAEGISEFFLWQAVHAHQKAALLAGLARPLGDQVIDGFPAAQIEIAYTEVRTL